MGPMQISDACVIHVIKNCNSAASIPGSGVSKLTSVSVTCATRSQKSSVTSNELSELKKDGVDCEQKYIRGIQMKYLSTDGIPGLNPSTSILAL